MKVWVVFKASGEVLCAYSTCMAGLGEACSQIAVLFTAEGNTRVKSQFFQHLFHARGFHDPSEV